jgi:ketosteroid isomerase-like protein
MSEVEEFVAAALPRQRVAEIAILNGDAGPRKLLWSHNDPVTVLGADRTANGWSEVEPLFDWLGSNFSNCESSEFEVLAAGASGDLAYAVGFERMTASVGGQPPVPFALRVTLIFRREDGAWKAVHRHADPMPGSHTVRDQLGRLK